MQCYENTYIDLFYYLDENTLKISAVGWYSLQRMGSKRNRSRKRNCQHQFYEDKKKIKTINFLRALKIQNSPFNSDIPNVQENVDNYNITTNFGFFVKFIKQILLSLECGSHNVIIVDDLNTQMGLSHKH